MLTFFTYELNIPAIPKYIKYIFENKNDKIIINNEISVPENMTDIINALIHENRRLNEIIKDKNRKIDELGVEISKKQGEIQTIKLLEQHKIYEKKRNEELEKERIYYQYKSRQRQDYI